jgi:hypothetical protein
MYATATCAFIVFMASCYLCYLRANEGRRANTEELSTDLNNSFLQAQDETLKNKRSNRR